MYQTFLGEKRRIVFPYFFIKVLLLGITTTYFFVDSAPHKLFFLFALLAVNVLLLKKSALKIFRFLLISTAVLLPVWFFFVFYPQSFSLSTALQEMTSSRIFRNALIRLWALFSTGQLFLGVTSRHEIMLSLDRIHANVYVRLFFVILFNAISYLISSFRRIEYSYYSRVSDKQIVKDKIRILSALIFDALSLIFECKKVFFLNKDRVYASLGAKHPDAEVSFTASYNSTPHIHIRDVKYPELSDPIIREASFDILGGITIISGKNGSGKSTLFNVISGIIPAVLNADYSCCETCAVFPLPDIGYVLQGVEISFFYDTVERVFKHLEPELVKQWMMAFGMEHLLEGERPISELSAGECKATALLAELLDPRHSICLLDEPSAFLSESSKRVLLRLLDDVKQFKKILCITHDPELIFAADRVFRMDAGLLHPVSMKIDGPCSVRFFPRNTDRRPLVTVSVPQPLYPKGTYVSDAVSQENMQIKICSGESIAICGNNGAGKTTLGIYLQDRIKAEYPDLRVVMMLQDVNQQLFTTKVLDELLVGTSADSETRKTALAFLRRFDLERVAEQPPQFISGGQKRLVLILCMIMQAPQIVFLDEPFDSIDDIHREALKEFLCEYQRQTGCSYVILDQSADSFCEIIDRTITIRNYQIVKEDYSPWTASETKFNRKLCSFP